LIPLYNSIKINYWKLNVIHYILFIQIFTFVVRDLVGNNNNNMANCTFALLRKSNQPEDGS